MQLKGNKYLATNKNDLFKFKRIGINIGALYFYFGYQGRQLTNMSLKVNQIIGFLNLIVL